MKPSMGAWILRFLRGGMTGSAPLAARSSRMGHYRSPCRRSGLPVRSAVYASHYTPSKAPSYPCKGPKVQPMSPVRNVTYVSGVDPEKVVPRGRIEPPTRGFSVLGVLYPPIYRHICCLLNYLIYEILSFPTHPHMMVAYRTCWYHGGTTRMGVVGNVHVNDRAMSGTSCTSGINRQVDMQ